MRNRVQDFVRPVVRAVVAALAGLAGLVVGAGSAAADTSDVLADTQVAAAPFGLLGPVGLGAVAVGIIGMVIGTARRRRAVLARSAEARMAAEAHRAAAMQAARTAAQAEQQPAGIPGPSRPPAAEQRAEPLNSLRTGRAA